MPEDSGQTVSTRPAGHDGPYRHSRRRRVIVPLLIALSPAVILAGAWRLGGASALEDDLIYYLPVRAYIGERIRAGEFPLWNPLVQMGTSIAADPQAGLWYPPTALFALLPPLVAYPVTIWLHFVLAGAGMYRLLRAQRRDWTAALLGAIAFEFCGFLVAHRAHLTILESAAWLPWIFLGWQRFARTGRYRHFALASLALGMQMLVQHVQVTIITCTLLTGYLMVVLLPARRRLLWTYPLGMLLGLAIGAIQLLPTWYAFAESARAAAAYTLFVENSWVPMSSAMLLFPMLFGSRTPNLWDQPWWGLSHFCEQNAYGSIPVLMLAVASAVLLFHRNRYRREVAFWWSAGVAALILALGEFTPASEWLFHVPLYRNLRVPARWILVWSAALPILASATVDAVIRGRRASHTISRGVKASAWVVIPLAALICLGGLFVAAARIKTLEQAFAGQWRADEILAGLAASARMTNPAIWWPILLMLLTAAVVVWWLKQASRRRTWVLISIMLIDLAGVAAFVDVDVGTYTRSDLAGPPPLARAIREMKPDPGHRLLVPRVHADYDRPLEVLWPQSNLMHGISTVNGYGPLLPERHRIQFRFMPWGSSEGMLQLLRDPMLLRRMGVRFIAVRTEEEVRLLRLAAAGGRPSAARQVIHETVKTVMVEPGEGLLWPIRLDAPGLYRLEFDAEPVPEASSRWFIRLEDAEHREIGWTRTMVPADLAGGSRRITFLFDVDVAAGPALVRLKSERSAALYAGNALFERIADLPAPDLRAGDGLGPFVHRGNVPGGITLYELPGACPLVWYRPGSEAPVSSPDSASSPATTLIYERPAGHHLRIWIDTKLDTGTGLLVFNESFDRGWRASLDKDRIPIVPVNDIFMGVTVPAGKHEIRFRYRPRGLMAGAGLTGLSLLILLAGFGETILRHRAYNEVQARKASAWP